MNWVEDPIADRVGIFRKGEIYAMDSSTSNSDEEVS